MENDDSVNGNSGIIQPDSRVPIVVFEKVTVNGRAGVAMNIAPGVSRKEAIVNILGCLSGWCAQNNLEEDRKMVQPVGLGVKGLVE